MTFQELYKIIQDRKKGKNKDSYVYKTFESGRNRIIQKVGEEAIEVVIAAKNENKKEIISEVSDLMMHLLIMLIDAGVRIEDIEKELQKRHKEKTKLKKS